MVTSHNKRKHVQKTEKSFKDYDPLPATTEAINSTKTNQLKKMDYAEAILDFNFTKVGDNDIVNNNNSNNNNDNDSNNNNTSNINIMDNFSHNLFELQPFLANSNGGNFINTFTDFNSTASVDIYDTGFGPTVFLTDATTAAATAAVTAATNNRGLLMETLLGSVMTTATATVTSPSSSLSSLSSLSLSSSASLAAAAAAVPSSSVSSSFSGFQENFYETTVVAVNSMKTSNNESGYWELETADFDFLYRHSLAMTIVYCIAYVIVFLVGLVGNSFVIAVVLRMRNMRTVTNYFIVNLAIADILVIVFCLPATLMSNIFVRKY